MTRLVTDSALSQNRMERLLQGGTRRAQGVLAAAVLFGVMAALAPEPLIQMCLSAMALTLMGLGFAVTLSGRKVQSAQDIAMAAITSFIEKDGSPSFVCTGDGEVVCANASARTSFATRSGETLAGTLRNTFANPGGIIFRLKAASEIENGTAREDIVTRKGYMRLAVHALDSEHYLWRLEAVLSLIHI